MKLYDEEYKNMTTYGLLAEIEDLEKWSVRNGDRELDKIQQIKKLIEELKEK